MKKQISVMIKVSLIIFAICVAAWFIITIVSSGGWTKDGAKRFLFPNFDTYKEDFETIKDVVVNEGSKRYGYYVSLNNSVGLSYWDDELNGVVEVILSDSEIKSLSNITSNAKSEISSISVDENCVYIVYGGTEATIGCGILYTEDINKVKADDSDSIYKKIYIKLDGNWYAVIT